MAAAHPKLNVKISRLTERSFELNLKFSVPGDLSRRTTWKDDEERVSVRVSEIH